MREFTDFSELVGKTLTQVVVNNTQREDEILFYCSDGSRYKMYHSQDCCENVYIEDICGNFDDLLNEPVLLAEESTNSNNPKEETDSFTWTFYRLVTNRGFVIIRWYGTSNGYYSETADFAKIVEDI